MSRALQENGADVSDANNSTDVIECPLVGFLPFTSRGSEQGFYGLGEPTIWPYTHLAAAFMAVDHFNEKNDAVVPFIKEQTEGCTVHLPDPVFANTDNDVAEVAKFLVEQAYNDVRFCGIVGPYTNDPAGEAANLASGMDIPMVSHGADSIRLTGKFLNPRVASVTVSLHALGEAAVSWFRLNGRSDFLATIAVTAARGDQFQETIDNAAKEANFTRLSFFTVAPPWEGFEINRGIGYALREIKHDGYRNIFLVLNNLAAQLPVLADYAEEFKMNRGEHVWMVSGNVDPAEIADYASQNENITKLVRGMSMIRPLDGFSYHAALNQPDPFLEAWKAQNSTLVDRINAMHPITKPAQKGYYNGEPSYFQTNLPEQGAGFMYDAVMVQALGRCKQQQNENPTEEIVSGQRKRRTRRIRGESKPPGTRMLKMQKSFDSNDHLDGIFATEFEGATGEIVIGESNRSPGSRKRETLRYGVYNFRESGPAELAQKPDYTSWYYLTHILSHGTVDGTWTPTVFAPFVFASGLSTPPSRNFDLPEQNYLSPSVQGIGFFAFALATLLTVLSILFVVAYRKKGVIRQSQPEFLYVMLAGCLTMTMAIITFSFDEGDGWTDQMLDRACIAGPWLISLGYSSIYCALFSKLWRINKVLQFARRKVEIKHVVAPFLGLLMCVILVLVVWTVVDPFTWERRTIDDNSLETYGQCESDHAVVYVSILAVLMAGSTLACALMAWKTKDIDSRFSESKWIFYTIFVQIQVLLLAIPILVVLNTASSDATYMGRVLVIFVVVMTTIVLMIGPKCVEISVAEKARKSTLQTALSGNQSSSYSRPRQRGSVGGGPAISGLRPGAGITSNISSPLGVDTSNISSPMVVDTSNISSRMVARLTSSEFKAVECAAEQLGTDQRIVSGPAEHSTGPESHDESGGRSTIALSSEHDRSEDRKESDAVASSEFEVIKEEDVIE